MVAVLVVLVAITAGVLARDKSVSKRSTRPTAAAHGTSAAQRAEAKRRAEAKALIALAAREAQWAAASPKPTVPPASPGSPTQVVGYAPTTPVTATPVTATPVTTDPSTAAKLAAARAQALKMCLDQAALTQSEATAASNAAWDQQESEIVANGEVGSTADEKLMAAHKQALASIEQQYKISVSSCHLQYG